MTIAPRYSNSEFSRVHVLGNTWVFAPLGGPPRFPKIHLPAMIVTPGPSRKVLAEYVIAEGHRNNLTYDSVRWHDWNILPANHGLHLHAAFDWANHPNLGPALLDAQRFILRQIRHFNHFEEIEDLFGVIP